jgi:hypothetical protein
LVLKQTSQATNLLGNHNTPMNKFARQTAAADASCAASDSQQLFYSSWFAGNEVSPPTLPIFQNGDSF